MARVDIEKGVIGKGFGGGGPKLIVSFSVGLGEVCEGLRLGRSRGLVVTISEAEKRDIESRCLAFSLLIRSACFGMNSIAQKSHDSTAHLFT